MQTTRYKIMKTNWYKNAVVYQVYPFSFMDANNDGWGDIPGIISKLDYIKELGATAVWFSPLYQSPDYDYGYDISNYTAIDEKFGTMADFDRLLEECHNRDLKVIMDMVINHTSTEHQVPGFPLPGLLHHPQGENRKGRTAAAFQLAVHLHRQCLGTDR